MTRRDGICLALVGTFLCAVLLPLMGAIGRERSKSILCQAQLASLGRAYHAYANDNDGFVPRDYWYDCNNPNSSQYTHYLFAAKFTEYLGAPIIPEAYQDSDSEIYESLEPLSVLRCPGVKDDRFVLNYVSNGMDFDYYQRTGGYTSSKASSLNDLPAPPSEIFYIMEANIAMLDPHSFGIYDVLYPGNMPFQGGVPSEYPRAIRHDDKRHDGRTTLVFFDGHCEPRRLHPDDLPITVFNPLATN